MISEYVYICHNCGREIWRNYWDEYAYKKQVPVNKKQHKTAYFCGWNCMREYERKKAEAKQREKNKGMSESYNGENN
jgi:DNA-directed RNA polymerase subunit RPC12/RpoP